MDERYWQRVGAAYERQIFSSSLADQTGVLRRRLDELADPAVTAADFGCGVGHYLPLLARRFRRVHGIDFAPSLLAQAEERTRGLANVELHQADLGSGRARLKMPKVRVAVCANVMISENESMRRNILKTIARYVAPGGRLLLVIPSLESALFVNQRWVEWEKRSGAAESAAIASGLRPSRELMRGLIRLDRVPTKHYLREEAEVLLDQSGFALQSSDKLEYGWETEFERPPRWMKKPGPWDWLLVAKRRR